MLCDYDDRQDVRAIEEDRDIALARLARLSEETTALKAENDSLRAQVKQLGASHEAMDKKFKNAFVSNSILNIATVVILRVGRV